MNLREARYLVLEDNELDQMVLLDMLKELDVDQEHIFCTPSINGILDQTYDFILCDLNLEDSFTLDTVKSVRKLFPETVLIVLTGIEDLDLAMQSIQYGAQDYLLKGTINAPLLHKTLMFAYERDTLSKQVKLNEARFRSLIDYGHDGIFIMDEETVISYASPSLVNLLGYTPEELLGVKAFDLLHQDDKPFREEAFRQLLNREKKYVKIKQRLIHKNAQPVWVNATISDHRCVSGINGIVSNFKNIDQEEHVLEQLIQSERRLSEIINTIPGVVLRYQLKPDGSDKLLFISEGPNELRQISPEEALENVNTIWSLIVPSDVFDVRNSIIKSAEELSIWNHRFRVCLKNGQERWLNGIGTPLRQPDGSVIWDSILFDITDQVNTEQALIISHDRFELVGKATNDAIWDWNLHTDELYCGEGFEKIFGYNDQTDGVQIQYLMNKIHPQDSDWVFESIFNDLLKSDNSYWKNEFRVVRDNGDIAFVFCQAYVVFDESGSPRRMVGAIQDVTEKRKLLSDLTERNKELSCLFTVSQLVNNPDKSISEIIKQSVEVLPTSWQFIGKTCSRIILYDQVYTSTLFKESKWVQKASIKSKNKKIGVIEVFYDQDMPKQDEGPFLKEERDLIDTVAKLLGTMVEKRDTEVRLLKERLLLRTVIDNIPDRVYVKDAAFKFMINNKANMDFIGAENEMETLGKTCFDFHNGTDCKKAEVGVMKTGKTQIMSDHRVNSNGENYRFHTTVAPLMDNHGKVVGTVGISRDITQSKLAEEKLMESEANLRTIFDNTDIGYILVNRDFKILSFNLKAYEYSLNYQAAPYCIHADLLECIPKDQRSHFHKKIRDVINKNKTLTFENEFKISDNWIEWYRIKVIPVKTHSNTVVGACISINNLTRIRQAELKLRRTATNMRALLDSTEDAYVLLDRNFCIKTFNEQALRNAKIVQGKEFKMGDNILDYVPEPKEAVEIAVTRALSGEKVDYMQNFVQKNDELSFHIKVNPIITDNNEIEEVSIVTRNITERKLYEKELIFQQQLLLNSQQLANIGSFEWDLPTNTFNPTGDFFYLFDIRDGQKDIKEAFFDKIHSGDKYFVFRTLKSAVKNKSSFNIEFMTVPIHEKNRIIKGKGIASSNNQGKVTKIFCALQDITEQKTADQAMILGQELERDRLAKDLHDDIGQLLTATKFRLEAIENGGNDVVAEQIESVKDLLSSTIKEVRYITKNLSTKILEQYGLKKAIAELCKPFHESNDIEVIIKYDVSKQLDHKLQLTIYRIIQEAINNIIKHASANCIKIDVVEKTSHISLEITDNGIGFDSTLLNINYGNGLSNIKERTTLFRGSFEIESKINKGTKVICKFPKLL